MEAHRLKPMIADYDPKIFNELYTRTEGLRKKLNSHINSHRFGLSPEDTLSWFDDKFIFIFNKYYHQFNKEVLLGHLITGLSVFKCRILRGAYTKKYSQTIIQIEDPGVLADLFIEDKSNPIEHYRNKLNQYMKAHLSNDALFIFEIQLNPPPYIINKLNSGSDSKKLDKITDELIFDYLDLPINKKTLKFISGLKEEIKRTIELAKNHFKQFS